MTEPIITFSETDSKSQYIARVQGLSVEADLTTSKVSDTLVIVDHTWVPDEMRGMGIAGALAERVIADARARGQRLVPLCPFLRAYATKRREELSDVIQW
jgi:predicted GNAT family acetyltransferase